MAEKEKRVKKKGAFGALWLSVSKKYIFPDRRRKMMVIGSLGALTLAAYFALDFLVLKSSLTSSGPLSSYHATFEKDCGQCHDAQLKTVSNEKCSVCHEKVGDDLGVYSMAAHDVYRSGMSSRIRSSAEDHPCYLCHQEHLGREALITEVPDSRCTGPACHDFGSLAAENPQKRLDPSNQLHPQFDFITESLPDDSTMKFTHVRHVAEVIKYKKLPDIERACLYCHNPQPDGRHFDPVEFDKHCDTCHLSMADKTPRLPVKSGDAAGVESLETIRNRRGPGTQWAFYANPSEIKPSGSALFKQPLYHEDPWIMENLKMTRRTLYPARGLADLLKTSGTLSSPNDRTAAAAVYQEALQALQNATMGLRGQPQHNVQNDLSKIDSLLSRARKRLRDQPMQAADLRLFLEKPEVNPNFTLDQIQEYDDFINSLTEPCQKCHMLAEASIARVRKEQIALVRAEFDHRAHLIYKPCLECHAAIAITEGEGDSIKVRDYSKVSKSEDRSAIQNLPGIDNCTECHNPSQSSNRCVTCHYFHPNKTNRSRLLLYLD